MELEAQEIKEENHGNEIEEITHTIYSLKQKLDDYKQFDIDNKMTQRN